MIQTREKASDINSLEITRGISVILDTSGNILDCRSYLANTGQTDMSKLPGRKWDHVFIPAKHLKDFSDYFEAIANQNGNCNFSDHIHTSKGGVTLLWHFRPTKKKEGSPVHIHGIGCPLPRCMSKKAQEHIGSTQNELRKQLHHTDRLATVGQLAAGLAHELNGPLGNILGYAQLSSKTPDLPDQVYQDLDHIVRLSLHAREIVKKVMFFSRTMPPNRKKVNLNSIIEESLHFTEPFYSKNEVQIIRNLSPDLPDITADPSQIYQVMVNLLVNAVQAMEDYGGQITIKTALKEKKTVTFSIGDTGTGMTEETLEQCFMPFYTTKDVDKGTGLGLSVVHGIVTAHGGTIEADSKKGKGSIFRITLPKCNNDREEGL